MLTPVSSSREPYSSDLTDAQWMLIERFVRPSTIGPAMAVHSRREIVNAILYIVKTGAQWRSLPHDFPPWKRVYAYFSQWKKDGTWGRIHDALYAQVRISAGREPGPTAAIIDSQSAKTTEEAETRGFDANKKVKGRKRHIVVDSLGLLIMAWITTADVQDRHGAAAALPLAALKFPSLQKVWADGAYEGPQVESIAREVGLTVDVVKRSDGAKGFVVQAKRWIVERTFGWLNRLRRLSKDYERREDTVIAFISVGMIRLMLGRLA